MQEVIPSWNSIFFLFIVFAFYKRRTLAFCQFPMISLDSNAFCQTNLFYLICLHEFTIVCHLFYEDQMCHYITFYTRFAYFIDRCIFVFLFCMLSFLMLLLLFFLFINFVAKSTKLMMRTKKLNCTMHTSQYQYNCEQHFYSFKKTTKIDFEQERLTHMQFMFSNGDIRWNQWINILHCIIFYIYAILYGLHSKRCKNKIKNLKDMSYSEINPYLIIFICRRYFIY